MVSHVSSLIGKIVINSIDLVVNFYPGESVIAGTTGLEERMIWTWVLITQIQTNR